MTGPFAFLDNLTVDPMKAVSKNLKVLQQNQEMLQNGITDEQRKKAYYPRVSEAIFNNINPFSYAGHEDEMKSAVRDFFFKPKLEASNKVPDRSADKSRLDAFGLYLGLPQKFGTFKVSEHTPERNTDKDVTYYSIPNTTKILSDSTFIKRRLDQLETAKNSKDPEKEFFPISKDRGIITGADPSNVMGGFKISKGQDEKGHYLSYYDKWDLDPNSKGTYLSDLANKVAGLGVKMIGHPFEIYDRIYYDPKTYKPIK